MNQKITVGVIGIARNTFDVPYAEEMAVKAWANLESMELELAGPRDLVFDLEALEAAKENLQGQALDLLLIMQVTFADASMALDLARSVDAPVLLWSFPEERSGGRLRLNSVCGINLAAHALGKAGLAYDYLHNNPEAPECASKIMQTARAGRVKRELGQAKIGLIGCHPDGFDTCVYDDADLHALCGIKVESNELDDLFTRAAGVPDTVTDQVYDDVQAKLGNLPELEQESLRKSLKVYSALDELAREKGYAGMAMRCWPEIFTEFGCAACGPMAMMNQAQTPCACEADVYGVISTLTLQNLAGEPAFMTDMVDFNPDDDSGVFWHCGLAPISMADPEGPIRATIHSNRKLPLLNEFALKPGRITMARFSQSLGQIRLVIGGGEILRRPISFGGTSGVVRFDKPVGEVLDSIVYQGLEHHISIVYGDYRDELRILARMLNIPVLEIA
jgi:L-fucose isomerase-like protein